MLDGKRVVLGVTGGIAAYKACDLVSRLRKAGCEVRVVLTEHACRFVPPLTFETLSGNAACTDTFAPRRELEHIALAKWADAFVIAPATANCMAKLATGIADDLLSTTALAMTAPMLLAPAMNANMWRHPATQANLRTFEDRGARTVGPGTGHLACGDDDVGRMAEPIEIVEALDALLSAKRDLAGRRVLVTAGPTVERIDPVRYITNRSSGKMGYAVAAAAAERGAEVALVSGPVALAAPRGVEVVPVESSAQMHDAVLARAQWADIVVQAAAPADFRPKSVAGHKIKKTGGGMTLVLENTADIAAELGAQRRDDQVIVAFAAETDDLEANARGKLERKNADMVVANDVSRTDAGFGVDTNQVTLITRRDARALPLMRKADVAHAILDRAVELMGERA